MLILEKDLRMLIREELMSEVLREKDVLEEGSFKELLKSAALAAGVGLGSLFGGGVNSGALAKPAGAVESFEMNKSFLHLYDKVIKRLETEGVDTKNMQLFKGISSEIFVKHQTEQGLYEFLKICFSVVEKSGYDAFMQNIEVVKELGQKIIKKHESVGSKKSKSGSAKSNDGEHEIWMGTVRKKGEKMPSRWNVKR